MTDAFPQLEQGLALARRPAGGPVNETLEVRRRARGEE